MVVEKKPAQSTLNLFGVSINNRCERHILYFDRPFSKAWSCLVSRLLWQSSFGVCRLLPSRIHLISLGGIYYSRMAKLFVKKYYVMFVRLSFFSPLHMLKIKIVWYFLLPLYKCLNRINIQSASPLWIETIRTCIHIYLCSIIRQLR